MTAVPPLLRDDAQSKSQPDLRRQTTLAMRIASCHKSLFMEENGLNDSAPIGDSSVHRDRSTPRSLSTSTLSSRFCPSAFSLIAISNIRTDVAFRCRCVDCLFFELAIEHEDAVKMNGEVRSRRPSHFSNRTTPFVAPWHSIARNDEVSRNSVQPVLLAFAPEKSPSSRNGNTCRWSQRKCRFESNRITRS